MTALGELPRMSHSRWQTWSKCGEAYRRKYIEKQYGTPTVYQVAGTAFHEWTDTHDRQLLDPPPWEVQVETSTFAELVDKEVAARVEKTGIELERWDNPMHKADFNTTQLAKLRDELGPAWCAAYHEWRVNTGWEVATDLPPDNNGNTVGIEYSITVPVRSIEIISIKDRIFKVPAEGGFALDVVDTKTWSKRRTEAQLPTQLAVGRLFGLDLRRAMYYEARNGTTTEPVEYAHWGEYHLAVTHEQTAHAIAAGFFPPKPGDDCSSFCSQRAGCPFAIKSPRGVKA